MIELSQGSGTFDLVTTDNLSVRQPLRNKWGKPLSDLKVKNISPPDLHLDNLEPASLTYTDYQGTRWGLPLVMTTPVLAYRKDLFEKAGIDKVPAVHMSAPDAGGRKATVKHDCVKYVRSTPDSVRSGISSGFDGQGDKRSRRLSDATIANSRWSNRNSKLEDLDGGGFGQRREPHAIVNWN